MDLVGEDLDGERADFYGKGVGIDAGEQYSDTAKIDKEVRVVTTITFYLTE